MNSIRDDDAMENGCSDEDRHICEPEDHVAQVKNEVEDEKKEVESIEMIFIDKEVPSWKNQLTFRAFVVSFVLGTLLSLVAMKLHMTTGMIPSLNISAGLLGFLFGKTWTKFLEKPGTSKKPFTRQEYTMVQTCVVATCGIAFSGGFGSYMFAMSEVTSKQSMGTNDPQNTKNLSLGWITGFLFTVSFIGLFSLLHFRKIMIIDYKLVYPSGTATAHLINSFYTPQGAKLARKQVKILSKFLSFSFLWGCFQWFYTAGSNCGIASFPSLGFEAYNNRFYFNFSRTYVGVGMICSYITNISLLVGAIFSWGMMWPLIRTKEGGWYESGLPSDSLQGIHGYRVFITIAVILGDGLYNLFKVSSKIITELASQLRNKSSAIILPVADHASPEEKVSSFDDKRRTQFFLKDPIPSWFALGGYVIIASISTAILPQIFHQLKWYYVLIIHVFAPVLAFSNAYGCGLTDWSLASSYGKFAIFTIGAWAGKDQGGVLAGLAACGVMMNIVSTAGDLMQDLRTGYITLASPRSMFVSQVVGTAMGCVISPCVFWLFYKAIDDIGTPHSSYPVPFALVYRNMAILGAEGISSLPKNCLNLCYLFFAGTIIVNVVRDAVPETWANYIPLPVAMAIPFYIGAYFVVDMFVGCLILFVWEKMDKASADAYGVSVASGLIVGDGLWTLPSTILALAGVEPPICMKFLSRSTNDKVDKFLKTSVHI